MENCLMIGNKIEKETAENIGNFVEQVFRSGKETGMDQSTIIEGLKLFKNVIGAVEGVSVSNCEFTGEKIINIDTDEE